MPKKKPLLPSDVGRKRLIKVSSKTNPHYGKIPTERSIEELLDCGMIILDKPSGPTSHQVVSWVREICSLEKAGHGGTLDPHVTGVLPLGLGTATRALYALLFAGKEYIAVMKLHKKISEEKIRKVCADFVGDIVQLPPVRSAVKRVRRKRHIYYLELLEIKDTEVLFLVGCEAGTYIRTLCVDIGKKLKCGAHLAQLRRTRVGHLHEENAVHLQDIKDAYLFYKEEQEEKDIKAVLHPMEMLLQHLPALLIRDSAVDALCHGAQLALPGLVEVDTDIKKNDTVAVFTLKGEGVALARALMSTEEMVQKDAGVCADLHRVLMKKGTYPSFWKKS